MRTARFAVVGLVAALVALPGCADSHGGRLAVRGKVTVKGEPLKEASISFEPLDGQGTRGGTGVTAGAYAIPRDAGLKPGKYLVRLTAGDGKTPAGDPEAEAGGPGGSTNIVSVDLIPPDYGVSSMQTVTVTADGPNAFDFDLPALNAPKPARKR